MSVETQTIQTSDMSVATQAIQTSDICTQTSDQGAGVAKVGTDTAALDFEARRRVRTIEASEPCPKLDPPKRVTSEEPTKPEEQGEAA